MHVVRLLAPQLTREDHTKDIDFSPSGIMQRWDAGYRHTKAVLARKPWLGEFDPLVGGGSPRACGSDAGGGRVTPAVRP